MDNKVAHITPDGDFFSYDTNNDVVKTVISVIGPQFISTRISASLTLFHSKQPNQPYNPNGQEIWTSAFGWTDKIYGDIVLSQDENTGLDSDTAQRLEWWVNQGDVLYLQHVIRNRKGE